MGRLPSSLWVVSGLIASAWLGAAFDCTAIKDQDECLAKYETEQCNWAGKKNGCMYDVWNCGQWTRFKCKNHKDHCKAQRPGCFMLPVKGVPCQGNWKTDDCDHTCGEIGFEVTSEAKKGGICPNKGTTRSCKHGEGKCVNKDCEGEYAKCLKNCKSTLFEITKAHQGIGKCPLEGTYQACKPGDGDCPTGDEKKNCKGYFPKCDSSCGNQYYVVTSPAKNGGRPCKWVGFNKKCKTGEGACVYTAVRLNDYWFKYKYRRLDATKMEFLRNRFENGDQLDMNTNELKTNPNWWTAGVNTALNEDGTKKLTEGSVYRISMREDPENEKRTDEDKSWIYFATIEIDPPVMGEPTGWHEKELKTMIDKMVIQYRKELTVAEELTSPTVSLCSEEDMGDPEKPMCPDYGDTLVYDESKLKDEPCMRKYDKKKCTAFVIETGTECKWEFGIGCVPSSLATCGDIANPSACANTNGCWYDTWSGCRTERNDGCYKFKNQGTCGFAPQSMGCFWHSKPTGCIGPEPDTSCGGPSVAENNCGKNPKNPACYWNEVTGSCDRTALKCDAKEFSVMRYCNAAPGCMWTRAGTCIPRGESTKCSDYKNENNCNHAGLKLMLGCRWNEAHQICRDTCKRTGDDEAIKIWNGDWGAFEKYCEDFNTKGIYDSERTGGTGVDRFGVVTPDKDLCNRNNCMWGTGRNLNDQSKRCLIPNKCIIMANSEPNPWLYFMDRRKQCCAYPRCEKRGFCILNRQACLQAITADDEKNLLTEKCDHWGWDKPMTFGPDKFKTTGEHKYVFGQVNLGGDESFSNKFEKSGHWTNMDTRMSGLPPGARVAILLHEGPDCDNIGDAVWNKEETDENPYLKNIGWVLTDNPAADAPADLYPKGWKGTKIPEVAGRLYGQFAVPPNEGLKFEEMVGKLFVVTEVDEAGAPKRQLLCGKINSNRWGQNPCDVKWNGKQWLAAQVTVATIQIYSAHMDAYYTVPIDKGTLEGIKRDMALGIRTTMFVDGLFERNIGDFMKGGNLTVDVLNISCLEGKEGCADGPPEKGRRLEREETKLKRPSPLTKGYPKNRLAYIKYRKEDMGSPLDTHVIHDGDQCHHCSPECCKACEKFECPQDVCVWDATTDKHHPHCKTVDDILLKMHRRRLTEATGTEDENSGSKQTGYHYKFVISVYPNIDTAGYVDAEVASLEPMTATMEDPTAKELQDLQAKAMASLLESSSKAGLATPVITALEAVETEPISVPIYTGEGDGGQLSGYGFAEASGTGAGGYAKAMASYDRINNVPQPPGDTWYPSSPPTAQPSFDPEVPMPCKMWGMDRTSCEAHASDGCLFHWQKGCNTDEAAVACTEDQYNVVLAMGQNYGDLSNPDSKDVMGCVKDTKGKCKSCLAALKPDNDCGIPNAGTLFDYYDGKADELCSVITTPCAGDDKQWHDTLKDNKLGQCAGSPKYEDCYSCVLSFKPEPDCRAPSGGSLQLYMDERGKALCEKSLRCDEEDFKDYNAMALSLASCDLSTKQSCLKCAEEIRPPIDCFTAGVGEGAEDGSLGSLNDLWRDRVEYHCIMADVAARDAGSEGGARSHPEGAFVGLTAKMSDEAKELVASIDLGLKSLYLSGPTPEPTEPLTPECYELDATACGDTDGCTYDSEAASCLLERTCSAVYSEKKLCPAKGYEPRDDNGDASCTRNEDLTAGTCGTVCCKDVCAALAATYGSKQGKLASECKALEKEGKCEYSKSNGWCVAVTPAPVVAPAPEVKVYFGEKMSDRYSEYIHAMGARYATVGSDTYGWRCDGQPIDLSAEVKTHMTKFDKANACDGELTWAIWVRPGVWTATVESRAWTEACSFMGKTVKGVMSATVEVPANGLFTLEGADPDCHSVKSLVLTQGEAPEVVTTYDCEVGQGQSGKSIKQTTDTSEEACTAQCTAEGAECVGIDWSTKTGAAACRLYKENTPRLGNGGNDNRQYCAKKESAAESETREQCTVSDLKKSGSAAFAGCDGLEGYQPVQDFDMCTAYAEAQGSSVDSGNDGKDCVYEGSTTRYRMVNPAAKGGVKMFRICAPCTCDMGYMNEKCGVDTGPANPCAAEGASDSKESCNAVSKKFCKYKKNKCQHICEEHAEDAQKCTSASNIEYCMWSLGKCEIRPPEAPEEVASARGCKKVKKEDACKAAKNFCKWKDGECKAEREG